MLIPAWISTFMASIDPPTQASHNALLPSAFLTSRFAPAAMIIRIISAWPLWLAFIRGVVPFVMTALTSLGGKPLAVSQFCKVLSSAPSLALALGLVVQAS